MILGCILILIGIPFAAANWYSPFSESISGRHSSMVPPVGGFLIGAGTYWITGSLWWALLGIPSDLGLLFLIGASPWLIREGIGRSRFGLINEWHGWHDGHRTILKLFRDSGAMLSYGVGSTQYGRPGTWVPAEEGYLVTFDNDFECQLEREGDVLKVTAVKMLIPLEHCPMTRGQTFEPQRKT